MRQLHAPDSPEMRYYTAPFSALYSCLLYVTQKPHGLVFFRENMHVPCEAEHLKSVDIRLAEIRKTECAAGFLQFFDNTQQHRNSDSVDKTGFTEVQDNFPDPGFKEGVTFLHKVLAGNIV